MKPLKSWNDTKTAPKDGTLILADVGLPWPVVAVWNSHRVQGVTVMLFNDAVHETSQSNHIIIKEGGYCAEVGEDEWDELNPLEQIELVCEAGEHVGDLAELLTRWHE